MKLLLLEDDAVLSDILLDFLREFYNVDYAFDSDEAQEHIMQHAYDLFIFDINVPGKNGLKFLEELRHFNNTTPAIIITAYHDIDHLQQAFNSGAHDYIKKPFELEELHSRIENSRRLFHIDTSETVNISEAVTYDMQRLELRHGSKHYTLTAKEAEILHYFISHAERTISNEELAQNLWSYDEMPTNATIRSHIRSLRDMMGKEHIVTVRGVGYRFERTHT